MANHANTLSLEILTLEQNYYIQICFRGNKIFPNVISLLRTDIYNNFQDWRPVINK